MHITNKKISFDIFTKHLHGTCSLFKIIMFFGIKKLNHFDPYHVFLAIATNIPQRLKTGFVVQGHMLFFCLYREANALK